MFPGGWFNIRPGSHSRHTRFERAFRSNEGGQLLLCYCWSGVLGGLPGLSGFIAEFMIFTGTFRTYLPLAVLAVIGAALTAVYILRLLARTFLGESDAQWEHLTDSSAVEKAVGGAFVLILLFVGIWPEPLMRVINVGVAGLPGV